MALPSLPVLVGGGTIVTIGAAIVGFALAVRTNRSATGIALIVGALAIVSLVAFATNALAQTAITVLAYAILVTFPLYALFWTLHDFVERVVRA
jgi:hypothetical protein